MRKTKTKTPGPLALIQGLRSIGYSIESSIADIIDNSLPVGSTRVDILFSDQESPYIAICDDGSGMSVDELDSAMDFGNLRERDYSKGNELGRFGLGLKTASLSQCRKFSVITKKCGVLSGACWDVDYIEEKDEWDMIILSPNDINKTPCSNYLDDKESGTIVVWEKLDKIASEYPVGTSNYQKEFNKKLKLAYSYCSLVFHRYYKNISISFNGRRVEKRDPFLSGCDKVEVLPELKIAYKGKNVVAKPVRMPAKDNLSTEEKDLLGGADSLVEEQGLYIYRNNRLILWGKWFHLEHRNLYSHLARIAIDYPPEQDADWQIDVKKSSAIIPPEIKNRLKAALDQSVNSSRRRIRYDGEKEVFADGREKVWVRKMLQDKSVTYELNQDHPILMRLRDNIAPEDRKLLSRYIADVVRYIPTSKMRDDVDDSLSLNNGKELTEIEIEQKLYECVSEMSKDDDDIEGYIDLFCSWEDFSVLRKSEEELVIGYKKWKLEKAK